MYRDQAGQSVGGNNLGATADAGDDGPPVKTQSAFSAAAFGVDDMMNGGEGEDFGGLMVCALL